jgi:tetratricopeptide (TPR) repeat protein
MNRKQRRAAKSQGEAVPARAAPAGFAGAAVPREPVPPPDAEAQHKQGIALLLQHRPAEAIACFERALALRPDHAQAHYHLGIALMQTSRLDDAAAQFERALAIMPDYAQAHVGLGAVRMGQEKLVAALAAFERALAIQPGNIDALNNRGSALRNLKRFADALESYDRVLTIKPDHVEALYNRGNALQGLKRHDEALASFDQALAIRGDYVLALNNRGNSQRILRRYAEALASFDRALAIKPDYAETHWNRSCLQLLLADFAAGWAEYEWRWRTQEFAPWRRDFAAPPWLGETPLDGKTILLHAEQGLGDAIQFLRYLPMVAASGARIVLEVQAPLKALLAGLSGIEHAAAIVVRGETLPGFDCHCPLASLPLAFKTRLDTIPATIPYVSESRDRVTKWRERLPESGKRRIGIAWAGNPAFRGDEPRSIGLARFAPLLEHFQEKWNPVFRPKMRQRENAGGIEFLSLQRDLRQGDRDILRRHPQVVQPGDAIADFADTAALMSLVDLVISSDTSVVHLAGAMGKPVWVLLHTDADWRWLVDRGDSPWYPTARLFRQPKIDDWESVVARVADELAAAAG